MVVKTGQCYWLSLVEARDAARHPSVQRAAPHDRLPGKTHAAEAASSRLKYCKRHPGFRLVQNPSVCINLCPLPSPLE